MPVSKPISAIWYLLQERCSARIEGNKKPSPLRSFDREPKLSAKQTGDQIIATTERQQIPNGLSNQQLQPAAFSLCVGNESLRAFKPHELAYWGSFLM